jgi:hypothetical protein
MHSLPPLESLPERHAFLWSSIELPAELHIAALAQFDADDQGRKQI